jgi:hypothetical protein
MQGMLIAFRVVHALMAVLFAVAALVLMAIAAWLGWTALSHGLDKRSGQEMIEAVGILTAAVVALQISQTLAEEEVVRSVQVSAPTRVRRYLSRFVVVVVVALSIEGLVATFKAVNQDISHLTHAAAVLLATAAILAAWGIFVRLNRAAEELEPEAMREAQREDDKFQR